MNPLSWNSVASEDTMKDNAQSTGKLSIIANVQLFLMAEQQILSLQVEALVEFPVIMGLVQQTNAAVNTDTVELHQNTVVMDAKEDLVEEISHLHHLHLRLLLVVELHVVDLVLQMNVVVNMDTAGPQMIIVEMDVKVDLVEDQTLILLQSINLSLNLLHNLLVDLVDVIVLLLILNKTLELIGMRSVHKLKEGKTFVNSELILVFVSLEHVKKMVIKVEMGYQEALSLELLLEPVLL
jgi:hypothetical protein